MDTKECWAFLFPKNETATPLFQRMGINPLFVACPTYKLTVAVGAQMLSVACV